MMRTDRSNLFDSGYEEIVLRTGILFLSDSGYEEIKFLLRNYVLTPFVPPRPHISMLMKERAQPIQERTFISSTVALE